MKIDVYDTYALLQDQHMLHFDVLLPQGAKPDLARHYAQEFLRSLGKDAASTRIAKCDFCHTEKAPPVIEKSVLKDGHYILQMEGCPNPYRG